jgi:hypothetical protein
MESTIKEESTMRQLFYTHAKTVEGKKIYRFSVERNTDDPEKLQQTLEKCKENNIDYIIHEKFMGNFVDENSIVYLETGKQYLLYKGEHAGVSVFVIEDQGRDVMVKTSKNEEAFSIDKLCFCE